jgi:hypothetical protein
MVDVLERLLNSSDTLYYVTFRGLPSGSKQANTLLSVLNRLKTDTNRLGISVRWAFQVLGHLQESSH